MGFHQKGAAMMTQEKIEEEIIKVKSDIKGLEERIREPEIIDNSNCVFNVEAIEKRLKELGALEDIECEVVETKIVAQQNGNILKDSDSKALKITFESQRDHFGLVKLHLNKPLLSSISYPEVTKDCF